MKKYIVRLTEAEQQELRSPVRKGRGAAYRIKHANILLKADEMVRLKVVESICAQTVRRTLKETNCSPTGKSAG